MVLVLSKRKIVVSRLQRRVRPWGLKVSEKGQKSFLGIVPSQIDKADPIAPRVNQVSMPSWELKE